MSKASFLHQPNKLIFSVQIDCTPSFDFSRQMKQMLQIRAIDQCLEEQANGPVRTVGSAVQRHEQRRVLSESTAGHIEERLKELVTPNSIILCDMDGTLIDTDQANSDAYKDAVNMVLKRHIECPSSSDDRITRSVLRRLFPAMDASVFQKIVQIKGALFPSHLHKTKVNRLLLEQLKKYRNVCPIYLVTKCNDRRVDQLLKYHKLYGLFDAIYSYQKEFEERGKYAVVMERQAFDPEQVIILDDSIQEIFYALQQEIENKQIININLK